MRFSLDWLRQYVELPEDAGTVASQLAAAGFPVDSVEPWGADHALDVDVTTNRPDAMCHLGLARELAARLGRSLVVPAAEPPRSAARAADLAAVSIAAPDLCSRYTGLVLTGVQVRPSPDWLQDRLASIGLRPINNLVDVTNFVLHELGQPLHAFDLDRLAGARVVVRRAEPGELLVTLDGDKRTLQADDLVIADGERAIALAGVMGGQDSEISAETTRVLLESAHFSPTAVRRTGRRLGLHTDASHRFERGTDPGGTLPAALRAAALILESAGGELAGGDLDEAPRPAQPLRMELRLDRLRRLLGLDLTAREAADALAALGFESRHPEPDSPALLVTVPTRRVDVTEEVDLIEEVGRMVGYDRVPATVPAFASTTADAPRPAAAGDRARAYLAAAGYAETIHFPMSQGTRQERFSWPPAAGLELVRLDNPLNREMDTLRVSLVPGLLDSLALNLSRGSADVRLFELGRVFREAAPGDTPDASPPLPLESVRIAAVARGRAGDPHWSGQAPEIDFFALKGALEGLCRRLTPSAAVVRRPDPGSAPAFLATAAAGVVLLEGRVAGWLGRLTPEAGADWDLPADVLAFELELPPGPPVPETVYQPIPRHPAAERDLALILPETASYERLEQAVRSAGGPLLETVRPFDRYAGSPIPAGHVSLAIHLVFRGDDRTLTAGEVEEALSGIVERLQSELDAQVRDA